MKKLEQRDNFCVPRSVQEIIPIKRVWENGIFQLTDRQFGLNQFSVTYEISDINYSISSPYEKKQKFLLWEAVLNAFDPDARYKISIFKHKINLSQLTENIAFKYQNDEFDEYRKVFNKVMIDKAMAANGITQEIYITVSTWKKDVNAASAFFSRQFAQISQALAILSSRIQQLDAVERLRVFHDFYRQGEESAYNLDFKDLVRQGADVRDYICPDTYGTDNGSPDHFMFGNKYGRALFLRTYASFIQDDIVTDLCNINRPCCLSIDLVAIPTDEAVNAAQNIKMRVEGNKIKYLRKAANKGMYGATITYDMQQQLEEADEFLNDLTERDQRMFVANVSMVHLADSLQELQSDTEEILASARKGMCNMGTLMFQQLQGLTTALPYGVNRLNAERTLTTESASIFMPFRAQEVTDKGGLFAGVNAVTGNLLLTDLQLLNNPNRFVIGIPGSGKSFGVKMNIFQIFLNTNHDIIILDPECEYAPLVKAIGGQVITLSASSDTHINPFDMVAGYAEHSSSAYYEKSNFIVSLFEQIDKSEPLGGNDKSIIDRCVINIYKNCKGTPTLYDLRKELEAQPEPRAKELALKLELFTTGSLNVFSNQTNVKFKNRIICFDTSKLEGALKTIGNLIVSDCLVNRVTSNFKEGKLTDLFFDEFQTFLKDKYSAEYFNSAWRRYRKRGASPCGITQNIEYLKSDVEFSTMLGNSTCVTLYQLTADDIKIVSDMYNLSEEQLKFVSETTLPGNGLMRIGGSIVPFDGQWPKNNALYKLMTTKPDEWCA